MVKLKFIKHRPTELVLSNPRSNTLLFWKDGITALYSVENISFCKAVVLKNFPDAKAWACFLFF